MDTNEPPSIALSTMHGPSRNRTHEPDNSTRHGSHFRRPVSSYQTQLRMVDAGTTGTLQILTDLIASPSHTFYFIPERIG